MPRIQQNGDGFQYSLTIMREGFEQNVQPIPIDDWQRYEYYYETGSSEIYEPYIITMRARNSVGFARSDPVRIRGFTGESSKSGRFLVYS
jgi:hypothetical protein